MKLMQVNIISKWKDFEKGGKDKDKYLLQSNLVYTIMPE